MKPLESKKIIIALAGSVLLTVLIPLTLFASAGEPRFVLNSFFANITFMGDAIFGFACVFFILFFRGRKDISTMLLYDLMITLALVQLIKNCFSGQAVHLYFEANVPGAFAKANFISGHTAVAFTLAFFFASHGKNIYAGTAVLLLAGLVAYSRFYFGNETFFSLALGLIPAVIARVISQFQFEKKISPTYKKRRNLNAGNGHWMPA